MKLNENDLRIIKYALLEAKNIERSFNIIDELTRVYFKITDCEERESK